MFALIWFCYKASFSPPNSQVILVGLRFENASPPLDEIVEQKKTAGPLILVSNPSLGEDGGVCYRGREMECLSTMLKEGDDWLAQLAEVLEGTPDKPATAPSPQPSPQHSDSKLATSDACCADVITGKRGEGGCDEAGGRRTRSRTNSAADENGSRSAGCELSAGAGSSGTRSSKRSDVVGGGGGNGKRPEIVGKVKGVDTVVGKPSRPEVKRESGAPSGVGNNPPAATRGSAAASLGRGKRATRCCASGRQGQGGEGDEWLSPGQGGARSASVSGTHSRVSRLTPACKYCVDPFGTKVWRHGLSLWPNPMATIWDLKITSMVLSTIYLARPSRNNVQRYEYHRAARVQYTSLRCTLDISDT